MAEPNDTLQITEEDIITALTDCTWGFCADIRALPKFTSLQCCKRCHDDDNDSAMSEYGHPLPKIRAGSKFVYLCHTLREHLTSDMQMKVE